MWPHKKEEKLSEVSLRFPLAQKRSLQVSQQEPESPKLPASSLATRIVAARSMGVSGDIGIHAQSQRNYAIETDLDRRGDGDEAIEKTNGFLTFGQSSPSSPSFSLGGRRPHGRPLCADWSSLPQTSDIAIAPVIAEAGSVPESPSTPGNSKPGSILLQYTEPTHGVFRSPLKPQPDVHVLRNTGLTRVSGQPIHKGQIRTHVWPGCRPPNIEERPVSPPVSVLLRDAQGSRSVGSLSPNSTQMSQSVPASFRPSSSLGSLFGAGETSLSSSAADVYLPFVSPHSPKGSNPLQSGEHSPWGRSKTFDDVRRSKFQDVSPGLCAKAVQKH
jgi:hypothetical protein